MIESILTHIPPSQQLPDQVQSHHRAPNPRSVASPSATWPYTLVSSPKYDIPGRRALALEFEL